MPVLVRSLMHEAVDFLLPRSPVAPVPQLPPMRPESTAQLSLLLGHAGIRIAVTDGQHLQCFPRPVFARTPGVQDRLTQLVT